MFDSVQMKVSPIYIEPDVLYQHDPKTISFVHSQTGAMITKYQIADEKIPYMT